MGEVGRVFPIGKIHIAAMLVWLSLVGFGFHRLLVHQATPGPAGAPLSAWPAASAVQPDSRSWTLVMLAHPRCPCTRASLGELALLMARCQGRLTAHVLFYKPERVAAGWERPDLWRTAAAIPGVRVLPDRDGAEARRFGILTSGHTLLYDREGRQRFSGGITAARGHSGDNAGRDAITTLVNDGRRVVSHTPAFGCPLQRPDPR